ncbi:hypothetical protein [Konateibacter massiliensis]|uniref:hypothetical protein n=1 Tax=Konateibacter massiliensis TaxID=2002841 RepID=UPI00117B9665|nr:hypothetical protein [Konateibacter massiliensis]
MKEQYRKRLLNGNEWIDSVDKYGLILTDDLDSLLGCAILKAVKDWDIEQVFLFKANKAKDKDYLGVTNNATHEAIGVDFAMVNGKCFDNHLTAFSYNDIENPESINLNRTCEIHRGNYFRKYNLSTVLLLWSLYDLPKENLSDELMMLLIAIDGSYEGFYTDQKYVGIHERWINDVLDLPKFLECEKRHTKQEFIDIKRKYCIHKGHGKIMASEGYLTTDIDIEGINELLAWDTDIQLELPTERFRRKAIFKDNMVKIQGSPDSIKAICENPFCYALTNKYTVNYSEEIKE